MEPEWQLNRASGHDEKTPSRPLTVVNPQLSFRILLNPLSSPGSLVFTRLFSFRNLRELGNPKLGRPIGNQDKLLRTAGCLDRPFRKRTSRGVNQLPVPQGHPSGMELDGRPFPAEGLCGHLPEIYCERTL